MLQNEYDDDVLLGNFLSENGLRDNLVDVVGGCEEDEIGVYTNDAHYIKDLYPGSDRILMLWQRSLIQVLQLVLIA